MFLSDIHLPDNIPLSGVFEFIKDLNPDTVILGGDIVDAKGLHGCEHMRADQVERAWYERDRALFTQFLREIHSLAPNAEIIYLEGNHEERYRRLMSKFPGQFSKEAHMRLYPEGVPEGMKIKWIPYGTKESYIKIADTIFKHGDIYPDSHSKQYALNHAPYKVVYGHLHDTQVFTIRNAFGSGAGARYALTAGCLTFRDPDYKKGAPNKWVNGFVSFVFDGKCCTPTPHYIENGRFAVGTKVYACA